MLPVAVGDVKPKNDEKFKKKYQKNKNSENKEKTNPQYLNSKTVPFQISQTEKTNPLPSHLEEIDRKSENKKVQIDNNPSSSALPGEAERGVSTNKVENVQIHPKSKASKNIPIQSKRNPKKKHRSDPIILNLTEILQVNKYRKKVKQNKILKNKFSKQNNEEYLSGNLLDSSQPKRSRGKHREVKKKRLTNLKLIIIKERIIKQKMRENAVVAHFTQEYDDLLKSIDLKAEVKKYLNELNQRKIKTLNLKKEEVKENNENKSGKDKKKPESQLETEKNVSKERSSSASLVKEVKFSKKLRDYCDNLVTPSLNSAVTDLIKELINLQDKMYARDPVKAKARRRHVSGMREVKKHLSMKKAKMIIIAPNLEKLQMDGSVYNLVNELKTIATSQNVPYVFALDKYKLGRCTKKNVPVSAFAVLNYEGLEGRFKTVLEQLQDAKKQFAELSLKPEENAIVEKEKEEEKPDVTSQVISSFISAFKEGLRFAENKENSE